MTTVTNHEQHDQRNQHDQHGRERLDGEADGSTAAAAARGWIEQFRRNVDRRYTSDGEVPRVCRLIDALVAQATASGFTVLAPSEQLFAHIRERKWPWPHMVAKEPGGYLFSFHLAESSKPGTAPKSRTLHAGDTAGDAGGNTGAPRWIEERSREFVATGQLRMRVDSDMTHNRYRTSKDSGSTRIETRLPATFDALISSARVQHRLDEALHSRETRVDRAQRECRREQLYSALCRDVRLHADLEIQRRYLDLVEAQLKAYAPRKFEDNSDVIELMRQRIDARDPLLAGGIGWAQQPEPTETDVFTYMRREQELTAFDEDQRRKTSKR